jgi:hypothetical protein
LYSSFDGAFAISGSGYINVLEDGSTALPNNFLRNGFSILIDVGNGNCGSLAGKEQGGCASDAVCAAGD